MSGTIAEFRNTNALWGAVFARTLASLGVTRAIVSPGSRSTPLTYALACESGIQTTPVLDERTAAFFALGIAKATHQPVVLVCTSGTAAANYLPAVVEAWHAQVPLLVITADRPPELRDCGAGQTINQHHLYGSHVLWEAEAPLPEATAETLATWRDLLATAWTKTQIPVRGPVHLNVPLRDPLPPAVPQSGFTPPVTFDWKTFLENLPRIPVPEKFSPDPIFSWAKNFSHGVIVAGEAHPGNDTAYATSVITLAQALGWPVLADALNPARHHDATGVVVGNYEAILRDPTHASALLPEAVLQLGQLPTSKTLREWLGATPLPTLLLSPGGRNLNPLHRQHTTLPHAITDFHWENNTAQSRDKFDPAWLAAWQAAHNATAARLAAALDNDTSLFEGKVAWLLARHLPDDTAVFFANSMPVRDAEYFWPVQHTRRRIFSNRGVNGIDGTLGTALGVADGTGKPTVLLTGDLSLLHDSNALLLAREFAGSLTVVLINNHGGGIFNHLPVARDNAHFERFWGTPQPVDFALLAAAHQVPFAHIDTWESFIGAVAQLPEHGLRILEIVTDRAADARQRAKLLNP